MVNLFEIDDDRGVGDAPCMANRFIHEDSYPVTPRGRDRSADDSRRRWVHSGTLRWRLRC